MFIVNFCTGAGNRTAKTIGDAKKVADDEATYTQQPIVIEDENGLMISRRDWVGCTSGIDDCKNPIQFGTFGYYGDWMDVE